jgi:membrane protein
MKRLIRFFQKDIWRISRDEMSPVKFLWVEVLKKLLLAIRFFTAKRVMQKAAALTYSTLLAIVPIMAVVFAIARGFGYNKYIEVWFRSAFESQPQAADIIIGFVNSYLVHTQSGVFLGVGLIFMLYTVLMLVSNVEDAFNEIWQVKKPRSIFRTFTDYLAMFFMFPIIIVLTSGISIFMATVANSLPNFLLLGPFVRLLIDMLPYVLMAGLFIALYIFMPNTRVRPICALVPGILAGIAMQGLQIFYIHSQMFLSSYNAIYGSFAALPLFMLWVQFSWYIVLFFALLTHTSQDYDFYSLCNGREDFSYNDRTLLSAALLSLICRSFRDGKEHYTASMLKRETGIPARLVSEMLNDLCAVKVLEERNDPDQKEPTYAPYEDIDNITVGKMLEKLNAHGKAYDHIGILNRINPQAMERINRIWSTYISGMNEVKISDLWNLADDKTSAEAQQKPNA